jgi:hypothetical protein
MNDLPKKGDHVLVACQSCSKPGTPNFHIGATYLITDLVPSLDKEGRLRIVGRRKCETSGEILDIDVRARPEFVQIVKPFEETVGERIGE